MLRTASASPGLEPALVAVGACGGRAHGLRAHTLLLARGPRDLEAPFPPLPEGAPCSPWDASPLPARSDAGLGALFPSPSGGLLRPAESVLAPVLGSEGVPAAVEVFRRLLPESVQRFCEGECPSRSAQGPWSASHGEGAVHQALG